MKVAILGYGVVGIGIRQMLSAAPGLEAGPVLVRPGKNDAPFKVTHIDEIISDPSVDAVAEAMGGTEPAFAYAMAVLKAKKHFVTANKALVAAHGIALAAQARQSGVAFLFSAACGGGVPLLHNLSLASACDDIERVGGILNGTTNFMLDAMQSRGLSYDEALKEAQTLGYAEADPTADVSGLDALRKIMLACAVAWGKLPTDGFFREGIENIRRTDVALFQSLGYTCRLITGAQPAADSVSAFVEPVLVPAGAAECAVLKNYNLARYQGKNSGPIVLIGQGAGRYPTASAVVRDLVGITRGEREMMPAHTAAVSAAAEDCLRTYFVRGETGLPAAKELGGAILTAPITRKQMHEAAQNARNLGTEVFFAAVEE